MRKIRLSICGMQCASCAQIIEMRFREMDGIKSVSVSSKNKIAEIEFDENKLSEEDVKKAITKIGYKVS